MCAVWIEAISAAVGALATVILAWLAVPNLRHLRRYVEATNETLQEQIRQGKASRRPFFTVEDVDTMDPNRRQPVKPMQRG
jgi:hypothetical protein